MPDETARPVGGLVGGSRRIPRTGATEAFVIAKLARERAGELVKLAEELEG